MRKIITPLMLSLVLLSTSGCVFLRLLELKDRFAHFDDHFLINSENGLILSFLHPVILEKDMWLMGLPPTTQKGDKKEKVWTYIFEKLYSSEQSEDTNYDLLLSTKFNEGKLSEVNIGEQYFTFIPKSLFVLMLKSIGGAEVDMKEKSAKAEVTTNDISDLNFPNTQDTIELLGLPYSQEKTEDGQSLEYRYRLKAETSQKTNENEKEYLVTFSYTNKGKLEKIAGSVPFLGKVNWDLTQIEKE